MARNKYKGVLTPEQTHRLTREEVLAKRAEGWLPPIAGGALESNIYGFWVSKQSGRGSPATMTVGTKKVRMVGGDINLVRADGTEPYSDGTLFGDTVDFVNTLDGSGSPVIQGQSSVAAYLTWLACGQEVVTGGVSATHIVSATGATAGNLQTLSYNGFTTGGIAWNSTASALQALILAATNSQGTVFSSGGSVVCTGGPLPATPITVTFATGFANQPVPLPVVGGTPFTTAPLTVAAGVTGTGYQHVATPADVGGFYSTWVKSVGKSVIYRGQFNDCRITSMLYEGSSASKVLHVTPSLLILDPGQILTADPTKTDDGLRPFIYTEAMGTFKIDNQVYRGHSAFAINAQWALTEWYGDDVVPFDLITGRATVALQGVTIILDTPGLARYNEQIYGTATPIANQKPLHTIPALGSYEATFTRINPYTGGASEITDFLIPSVKWDPGLAIPANPAGGPVEFAMAGEFRKTPGQPPFQVTITTPADVAYTV